MDSQVIALQAVRVTLQACRSLNSIPVEKSDFLVAAMSEKETRPTQHFIGKWPRKREDRWWLQVSAEDVKKAAQDVFGLQLSRNACRMRSM